MVKQYGTPGPRAIYPEICDSPSLGRCTVLANALFPRLIAQADDQGRLQGGARAVLLQCMPYMHTLRVDEVAEAMLELQAEGHVLLYAADGRDLLQLVTWWRWQGAQRRAYPSRWPAPRGWQDLVFGTSSDGLKSFDEAVAASSQRNAAIRGVVPQLAASRVGASRTGARGRPRAPGAVPCRADAVPPAGAREAGANGAGSHDSMRERAQAILDDPAASAEAKEGATAMLAWGGPR